MTVSRVFFVDSRVPEYASIAAAIGPDSVLFLIAPQDDAPVRMAEILADYAGLASVHLISHGAAGAMTLGATRLDTASLESHASQWHAIGSALADSGDLLLYGCNVGAGVEGRVFVDRLAEMTGADVAASSDITGAGGDWELETRAGVVASMPLTPAMYPHALAQVDGTSGDDTLSGFSGNDTLDGGAGRDAVRYESSMAGYRFGLDASGNITVTDIDATAGGAAGVDVLTRIEQVGFESGTVTLTQYAETRVNTTINGTQQSPAIASLSDGSYVVTWQSWGQDGNGWGVYMQRYDAAGDPLGAERRVNTTTTDGQEQPAVAGLADGGFVVTWVSSDGDGYGVYAQRYGASGAAVGDETRVNTTTRSVQDQPAITALADGGYAVVWVSENQDGDGAGVYLQAFDAAGVALAEETQVNVSTSGNQGVPAITALADGGFIVVWQSSLQDGSAVGVYAQRFDATGVAVGDETRVNSASISNPSAPSVIALADGGYVVAWDSFDQSGNRWDCYSRRFDATGSPVGTETIINGSPGAYRAAPVLAALPDGGYVLSRTDGDGNGYGVYSQRFDASGSPTGEEKLINATTSGDQVAPALMALSDGGYVVAWHSADGNEFGIYLQRFDAYGNTSQIAGDSASNTLVLSGGMPITVRGAAGDDTYVVEDVRLRLVERAGQGLDSVESSVSWTLAENIENLTLTGSENLSGTGNSLANRLQGNAGNDTLGGGRGNDTYIVNGPQDTVVELALEGNDTVRSEASWTLGENIENLVLTGASNSTGSGNALMNRIQGNAGDNTLSGGAGRDTLIGGAGNDTYIVGAGDILQESAAEGVDTAESAVNWTLSANLEHLVLTGTRAISGTGNDAANSVTGNSAANRMLGQGGEDTVIGAGGNDSLFGGDGADSLNGGAGADVLVGGSGSDVLVGGAGVDNLTGGTGADSFVFDAPLNGGVNRDVVIDFASGTDTLRLSVSVFGVLTEGPLPAGAFASGSDLRAAQDADDRIVYDTRTGTLYYDADGKGGAAAIAFAVFTGKPGLVAGDILIGG